MDLREKILSEVYGETLAGAIEVQLEKDLKSAKGSEEISNVFKQYCIFLWAESSAHTVKGRYTRIRSLIKELKVSKARQEAMLKVFQLPTSFYTALSNDTKEKEEARNEVKVELSTDLYTQKLQFVKSALLENSIKPKNGQTEKLVKANLSMIYLALATGRRFYEIIKTLNIKKKGSKAYFYGLAKKREDDDGETLAFLLDDDYEFLKKALKNVRAFYEEMVEDLDSKEINSKYSKNINRFATNLLGEEFKFHAMREMYTAVVVEKFMPENVPEDIFRAFVLGHEINVDSAQFYKKYEVKK